MHSVILDMDCQDPCGMRSGLDTPVADGQSEWHVSEIQRAGDYENSSEQDSSLNINTRTKTKFKIADKSNNGKKVAIPMNKEKLASSWGISSASLAAFLPHVINMHQKEKWMTV